MYYNIPIPVSNCDGKTNNVVISGDFPLMADEWDQFKRVLDAMEPCLFVETAPESAGLEMKEE